MRAIQESSKLPPPKAPPVNLNAHIELQRIIQQTDGDVDMTKVEKYMKKNKIDIDENLFGESSTSYNRKKCTDAPPTGGFVTGG